MKIVADFKELCSIPGVSGNEELVSEKVKVLFQEFCDHIEIDKFGSVIGLKKGKNGEPKNIVFMAHLDEVGMMVKKIDEKGFVFLTNIGGIDPKVLLAQEVIIWGKKELYGVIGAKPPHLLTVEEASKAPKLQELFVDLGMNEKEVKSYVNIGDSVTFNHNTIKLKNDISSKSLDNRAGIWSLCEAGRMLKNMIHENNIYFVTSVQEEVGLRGAYITSANIESDLTVVVDVCFGEYPEGSKSQTHPLGGGPVIAKGPVLNKCATNAIIEISKENNIPFNIDVEPSTTGTEAWAVQVARDGVPTVLISIPLRNMHTPIEQVNTSDLKNTAKLLSKIASITSKEMEEIMCY